MNPLRLRFITSHRVLQGQRVIDIGCGDGRILGAAANEGAIAEGFEISLLPYLMSQTRFIFNKDRNIKAKIVYKDFWHHNLSDADVVYFFLMPRVYPKLKSKLERELKSGVKVICYAWPVEGWQPVIIDKTEKRLPIFLYRIS